MSFGRGGGRSYRIFLPWVHYILHNLFIINVVWEGGSKLYDFPSMVTLDTPQFISYECHLRGCQSYRISLLWFHYILHNLFLWMSFVAGGLSYRIFFLCLYYILHNLLWISFGGEGFEAIGFSFYGYITYSTIYLL